MYGDRDIVHLTDLGNGHITVRVYEGDRLDSKIRVDTEWMEGDHERD